MKTLRENGYVDVGLKGLHVWISFALYKMMLNVKLTLKL